MVRLFLLRESRLALSLQVVIKVMATQLIAV